MTLIRFDEARIIEELNELCDWKRCIFSASCTERFFHSYKKSNEKSAYSYCIELREIMDFIWDSIGKKECNREISGKYLSEINNIIEASETNMNAYPLFLADMSSSVAYALSTLLTHDSQEAAWCARRVYEALDTYSYTTENIEFNKSGSEIKILTHPFIQKELECQLRDLHILANSKDIDLKTLARNFFRTASIDG